ncbi:hypothetical protein TrST_g8419, partial [Triparma strigata]
LSLLPAARLMAVSSNVDVRRKESRPNESFLIKLTPTLLAKELPAKMVKVV